MADLNEIKESVDDIDSGFVREVATGAIDSIMQDEDVRTLLEQLGADYDQVIQSAVDTLEEDEKFREEVQNLEQMTVDYVQSKNDPTLGEFVDNVLPAAGSVIAQLFSDNSQLIWELAVKGVSNALNYEAVQDFLAGKAQEALLDLVQRYLTGSDPKSYRALSIAGSIISYIAGPETWTEIVSCVVLVLSELAPLLEAGFNIVGGLLFAANQLGILTSTGAPFTYQQVIRNDTVYWGTSIQGITILFDSNPSITRPPIVVSTAKVIPSAVKKTASAMKFIPSQLVSLVRYVMNKINDSASMTEAVATLDEPYWSQIFQDVAKEQLSSLIERFYDYVKTMHEPRRKIHDKEKTLSLPGNYLRGEGKGGDIEQVDIPRPTSSSAAIGFPLMKPGEPVLSATEGSVINRKYPYRK